MTIKVQLIGPMTGKPNFNYDAFDAVEQHIAGHGVGDDIPAVPVNPANSFGRRQDLPRHQYLASSLAQVSVADAVCLLPGWQDSEGAKLEVQQALNCGLDFYAAVDFAGWVTWPVSRSVVEYMLNTPVVHTRRGDVYIEGGHALPILGIAPDYNWPTDNPAHPSNWNINAARRAAGLTEPPESHADGFVVRDSGVRQEYASGMRRDTQEGKPDYTLIDRAFLYRWAMHMVKGKAKYGEDNWRLADSAEELKRFQKSALRHLIQWLDGEGDEDHAAAVAFNIAAAEYVKDRLAA